MNSEQKVNNEIQFFHDGKEFIVSPDILDPNGNPLIVENNYNIQDNNVANFDNSDGV